MQEKEHITMRKGEITEKQAIALGRKASVVSAYTDIWHGPWERMIYAKESILRGSKWVSKLGAPMARVRQLESSPGLWVFDSAPSGHVFLIWSDGYKKHPWKGTFYEVIANPDRMDALVPAFEALVAVLEGYRTGETDEA
jgi:hypothetical protein